MCEHVYLFCSLLYIYTEELISFIQDGYLDKTELIKAFERRNIIVEANDIQNMIKDADLPNQEGPKVLPPDGVISLQEFNRVYHMNEKLKTAKLWKKLSDTNVLSKGTNKAIQRYEQHAHNSQHKGQLVPLAKVNNPQKETSVANQEKPLGLASLKRVDVPVKNHDHDSTSNTSPVKYVVTSPPASESQVQVQVQVQGQTHPPPYRNSSPDFDRMSPSAIKKETDIERSNAIRNASYGGSMLVMISIIRRVVFKI